jgi:hypothetical protein
MASRYRKTKTTARQFPSARSTTSLSLIGIPSHLSRSRPCLTLAQKTPAWPPLAWSAHMPMKRTMTTRRILPTRTHRWNPSSDSLQYSNLAATMIPGFMYLIGVWAFLDDSDMLSRAQENLRQDSICLVHPLEPVTTLRILFLQLLAEVFCGSHNSRIYSRGSQHRPG